MTLEKVRNLMRGLRRKKGTNKTITGTPTTQTDGIHGLFGEIPYKTEIYLK